MATNKKTQSEDPEVVIESAIGRGEQFIEKNGKTLLIALIVVVAIVAGYFGYQHLYKVPQIEKASAAMFEAQSQFERDSFELALRGSNSFEGFEGVAAQFGSTPQGNIAKHYAGICCLRLGQYDEALNYFKSFSNVSGAMGDVVSAQNLGLMGDTYVEMGNLQEGVKYYEKAVAHSDNTGTAPTYLKKAALVNESLGNFKKALEQYQAIKFNYPSNMLARDIDKYIALVEQKL